MGDPVHDVVVPVGGREQGRILRQRQRRQGRRKNEPTQRTNESLRPGWRGTGTPGAPATGRGGGEGHKRGVPGVGGVRVRGVDAAVGVFLGAVASFSFFLVVWMSCVSCLLPCLLELSCLDFQAVPSAQDGGVSYRGPKRADRMAGWVEQIISTLTS